MRKDIGQMKNNHLQKLHRKPNDTTQQTTTKMIQHNKQQNNDTTQQTTTKMIQHNKQQQK